MYYGYKVASIFLNAETVKKIRWVNGKDTEELATKMSEYIDLDCLEESFGGKLAPPESVTSVSDLD